VGPVFATLLASVLMAGCGSTKNPTRSPEPGSSAAADSPFASTTAAPAASQATESLWPASVSGNPLGPSSLPANYFSGAAVSAYLSYVTSHWDNGAGSTPLFQRTR
jgi:hypothetical protein